MVLIAPHSPPKTPSKSNNPKRDPLFLELSKKILASASKMSSINKSYKASPELLNLLTSSLSLLSKAAQGSDTISSVLDLGTTEDSLEFAKELIESMQITEVLVDEEIPDIQKFSKKDFFQYLEKLQQKTNFHVVQQNRTSYLMGWAVSEFNVLLKSKGKFSLSKICGKNRGYYQTLMLYLKYYHLCIQFPGIIYLNQPANKLARVFTNKILNPLKKSDDEEAENIYAILKFPIANFQEKLNLPNLNFWEDLDYEDWKEE